MPRRFQLTVASALAGAVLLAPCAAQEAAKPETARPAAEAKAAEPARSKAPGVPLRVQVVISRFKDEKKIASLPYTFTVTADGRSARMRMGVDTPVAISSGPTDGGKAPTSVQYRTVGTNIDCSARDAGDGRFALVLTVENSWAYLGGPLVDANATGNPLFRRFDTYVDPVLRDGQSVQAVASTDPVTGEVVKIDITLNVVR